jgi:hypothetical protein
VTRWSGDMVKFPTNDALYPESAGRLFDFWVSPISRGSVRGVDGPVVRPGCYLLARFKYFHWGLRPFLSDGGSTARM